MSKLTLVLDRKNMKVTPDAGAIRIDIPGQKFHRLPVTMIDTVIILGSPMISCGVWSLLAKENIPSVILPLRGTGAAVYVGAGLSATASKRINQYHFFSNHELTRAVARHFVHQKLENQKKLLLIDTCR